MKSLLAMAAAVAFAAQSRFVRWCNACDSLGLPPDVAVSAPHRSSGGRSVRREARAALKRRNVLRNRVAHKRAARK